MNNNIINQNHNQDSNNNNNNDHSNSIGSLLDAQASDSSQLVQMPSLDATNDIDISCGDDIK